MDERITANEWDKRRACPICRDIADKKVNLEGDIVMDDKTGELCRALFVGTRTPESFTQSAALSLKSPLREETPKCGTTLSL